MIWLAVNIVLPVALLNSALILTVLALFSNSRRNLFAALALVGGCYMLIDILNGWLSANFVNNIVKDAVWISGFAYINAAATGLSSWFLVQPLWSNAIQIRASDKRKSIMLMSISILLVAVATITIPSVYHSIQNPFATKFNGGGKVINDDAPVLFGNTESEQTETPPGITQSEAKNVGELASETKIVTLISPTYTFGDLPHLTFKDVSTNKEQEYECDWSLPAIKEIMAKCENQDDCPALRGQAYSVTLKLELMDVMSFDPESGGMKSTGKKEPRWVIIDVKKISNFSGGAAAIESDIKIKDDGPPPDFVAFEKAPEIVKQVQPKYPELARRASMEGTVFVRMWVDKEGKVRKVEIQRSDAEIFNQPTIEAAEQMLFTPALAAGSPVSVWVAMPFKFKLNAK